MRLWLRRLAFAGHTAGMLLLCADVDWAGAQLRDAPIGLLTRAEASGYRETSRYDDVVNFVETVVARSPYMRTVTMGYSMEGRALPVVIVGEMEDASPEAVKATGKLRVFVQANIHAGEVCGKEAAQILLRDLANGAHREWLDSLVLMIAPIYNADGNEVIRLTNRPYQHGPVAGMGQRANAQGLDLNRDNMKLESPEARSLVAFWKLYDPHIVMDLHTTNGTRHAYHITYAPPLHPDTDPGIVELARNEVLPAITRLVREKYGWDYYYYGNLPWRGSEAEPGWYTFSHQPRYLTNYVGMRNRLGLLSEAYSYATFDERIAATLHFVEEVADYAYRNASTIAEVMREADLARVAGLQLALGATFERSEEPVEILMGSVVEERNPYSGRPMLRRVGGSRPESLPEFGTFQPTETETVPAAYVIPGDLPQVIGVLDDHGIEIERLEADKVMMVERFVIDSTTVQEREYQGHQQRELFGSYETVELTIPTGTVLVTTGQPLGRLVFLLLEPRSDDGLANWNFFDEALEGSDYYPVMRVPAGY
ncbi:MAG: M14 family metallopeptidase [Gemmatimonadota bacterium]|nr:MAG: M14 family metallopeptidase [Gemmatimonadota bacterium]